jgi:hypothetical protein
MEGDKWLFRVGAMDYGLDVSAGKIAGGASIVEGSIAADRGAPLKVSSARRE